MRGIVIGIKSTSTASHITFDLYTHRKSAKKIGSKKGKPTQTSLFF